MSVQVHSYKVDDLAAAKDPDTDVIATAGTFHFAVGEEAFEIDLTEENVQRFRKKVEPYMAAGRRLRGRHRSRPRPVSERHRARRIRSWAAEHHIEVSQRGRIPASVIEQYERANGG